MATSRQDYQAMATALLPLRENFGDREYDTIIDTVANVFFESNPRFDFVRWNKACGKV